MQSRPVTSSAIACVLLAALLLPSTSNAELPIEFDRCRAVRASGERVHGEAGRFDGDVLRFRTERGTTVEIARGELRLLDVARGSKLRRYALAGAGIGVLTSILLIASVESEPYREFNDDLVLPVAAGLAGAGALIGGIVGSKRSEWTNVRLDSTGSVSVGIDPGGVHLAVRF